MSDSQQGYGSPSPYGQPPVPQQDRNPYAAHEPTQVSYQPPPAPADQPPTVAAQFPPLPPTLPPLPPYAPPGPYPQPGPYGMPPAPPRRSTGVLVGWTLAGCLVVAGAVAGVLLLTDDDGGGGSTKGGGGGEYNLTIPPDLEGGDLFLDKELTDDAKKDHPSVDTVMSAKYGADTLGNGWVRYEGLQDDEDLDAKEYLADLAGIGEVSIQPRDAGASEGEKFLCQGATAQEQGNPVVQYTCVWSDGGTLVSFTLTKASVYPLDSEMDDFADRAALMLDEVRPDTV
ncbi:hypothetical protein SRB5_05140 [Streptomyces sp. RB5]|uniref:Uncharacterized protein n=1 Tax=Streptomyces smaragdinus TaxID=2585196 RepID=A0A7K0CAH8_9ACTN|nr:hypothetical protein [Streptomyces smaragdinus]MQY10406.1 hypothetical protein [Streptomyces smaragdinus]